MAFVNLPGVFPERQDGGLGLQLTSNAPKVLVIGTASKGFSEEPYLVGREDEAASVFGTSGTLIRGMYEAKSGGAERVLLYRIGATAAKVEGIGVDATSGGVVIETANKDDSVNSNYEVYFDSTSAAQRLIVKNVDTGLTVYDRDWTNTSATIDRGEVFVSGDPTDGEGNDIGTSSSYVTITAINTDAVALAVTVTLGTDGTSPSRMELWELLYKAYKDLKLVDFDIVVPMNIFLDDLNVVDLTSSQVTALGLASLSDYPTAGANDDALGKVYVENYLGTDYFWWWMPSDPASPDFTSDGGANIYPGVGSATATTKIDGTDLAASDFHEVNFAYQLANFCYNNTKDNVSCSGMIGVLPPQSASLTDLAQWVGDEPTFVSDADGNETISSSSYDGTGLLGNKFMVGKNGFRSSVKYGGFILTDTGFVDGTEQTDRGGSKIDIGKYISVIASWPLLYNSYAPNTTTGYNSAGHAVYAGMVASLDPKSAPTNKVVPNVGLSWRINPSLVDKMAGYGYVNFLQKSKGIVVADAPTAARPDSDYNRLTTHRIIKQVEDAIRAAADPFIGEAGGAPQRAALQTACEGALQRLQKSGSIQRFDISITATPAQRVTGDATIDLEIVPAFELRRITLVISLSAI